MNQAPTPDNSSSCSNIEIGFLKKVACPLYSIDSKCGLDESSPYTG